MRLLSIALLLAFSAAWGAEATEPARLKAAFVVNFAKFTRWPETAAGGEVRICFQSVTDAVGEAMARMSNLRIRSRPVRVQRGVNRLELQRCHVIYVGHSDEYQCRQILARLAGSQILTVSELPGFTADGGMIELFPEGRKYRFTVNHDAVAASGLEIDARLLRLARKARGSRD